MGGFRQSKPRLQAGKIETDHTCDDCAGIQSATGALTQSQGHGPGGRGCPLERGGFAGRDGEALGDFECVVLRLGQH